MGSSVEYALVTSSALPSEIGESEHYISLEKEQWIDLVDYSTDLVQSDPHQEIVFLIVAKGTPEQQASDDDRRAKKSGALTSLQENNISQEQAITNLKSQLHVLEAELATLQKEDELEEEQGKIAAADSAQRQDSLRSKSISIFNALYNK